MKGGITPNADGKRHDQTFSFGTIPAGDYKLAIFKPDKYVPKIVPITVEDSAYDCGQLKLWLYGDVNYDGKVLANDAAQVNRYVNEQASIFDTGTNEDKIDRLAAADVVANGQILANDAAQISRYANDLTSIFDTII